MYFDLTDDQKLLRTSIEDLLRDSVSDAQLMKLYNGDGQLDRSLWKQLVAQGIPGVLLPESADGAGMDLLALTVVAQTCGYYAVPAPIVTSALAAWLLNRSASQRQRDRWLAKIVSGEAVVAFALNEGADKWLPDAWTLGGDTLNGTKTHVERAAEAQLFIVGLAGARLGLVERSAARVTAIDTLDRTRPLFEVAFESAPVDVLDVDATVVTALRDALLVLYAADAEGAGRRTMEMAVAYAKQRKQFGRLIGSFQGLQFQLADITIDAEPCFALVWYAAHAWDQRSTDGEVAAARAKAHVCDVAVKVGRRAVEAHGGIGYTWEYPLHVWLKRAMADRSIMGAPAVHRERVLALGI